MPTKRAKPSEPARVVLRETSPGHWVMLGEVARVRGATAREARAAAVMALSKGTARSGDVFVAILRSEWRVAREGEPR